MGAATGGAAGERQAAAAVARRQGQVRPGGGREAAWRPAAAGKRGAANVRRHQAGRALAAPGRCVGGALNLGGPGVCSPMQITVHDGP